MRKKEKMLYTEQPSQGGKFFFKMRKREKEKEKL